MPGHCCPRCVEPGAGRKVLRAATARRASVAIANGRCHTWPFPRPANGITVMDSKTDQLTLHTLLGNYPNAAALKDGRIQSPLVRLDFDDVKVPSTAFKPLVREGKYDLGELAIITYLQAKAAG